MSIFEIGKEYLYYKDGLNEPPITVTFSQLLRDSNKVRHAVFKKDKKQWWIPEREWKYIKEKSL